MRKIGITLRYICIIASVIITGCKESIFDPTYINKSAILFNPDLVYDTLYDIDNNLYPTIQIGTQVWMAENLRTTRYADGAEIPFVNSITNWDTLTTSKACCVLNDDISNKAVYGLLYTWRAANNGAKTSISAPSKVQGACPDGWHLPSKIEWDNLITTTGGLTTAGGASKEVGLTHWASPNLGATNQSGFTAIPVGYRRSNGLFFYAGHASYFWSATAGVVTAFGTNSEISGVVWSSAEMGFSVRCVKN